MFSKVFYLLFFQWKLIKRVHGNICLVSFTYFLRVALALSLVWRVRPSRRTFSELPAGPYGSYDKCEIRSIRARAKNKMKWNLALFNQVINYLILFLRRFFFFLWQIIQSLPGFKPLRYLFTKLVFFFYYQWHSSLANNYCNATTLKHISTGGLLFQLH